jgi:hypothetical protein
VYSRGTNREVLANMPYLIKYRTVKTCLLIDVAISSYRKKQKEAKSKLRCKWKFRECGI